MKPSNVKTTLSELRGATMRTVPGAIAALFVLSIFPVLAQSSDQLPSVQSPPTVGTPKVTKVETAAAALTTDAAHYPSGQNVTAVFTVTNTGKSLISYTYPTAQQVDFTVADATGKAIWHWSQDRVFGQTVTKIDLKPGQSKTYSITWNQRDDQIHPVPAGTYTVTATTTPTSRPVVTGGVLTNTNPDPTNMGVPTQDRLQTGAIQVKDTTPSLSAKATIVIEQPSS